MTVAVSQFGVTLRNMEGSMADGREQALPERRKREGRSLGPAFLHQFAGRVPLSLLKNSKNSLPGLITTEVLFCWSAFS